MSKARGQPVYNDVLTPTEWKVLHAVQHRLKNHEISARVEVSLDAVKFHVMNICQKLNIKKKAELKHWFAILKESVLAIESDAEIEVMKVSGMIG